MGSRQTTTPDLRTSHEGPLTSPLALFWIHPRPLPALMLDGRSIVLGRDDDCECAIAGSGVSRRHAELMRDGPIWVAQDLGSTNGTFVDGKRITRAPLGPGSLLRVGEWIGLLLPADLGAEAGVRELAGGLRGGPRLVRALDPARRAASSSLPILLEGETGTGKECVARAIHEWSGRRGAYVAVNCAALPESLAEAELFGHKRGAFTGAAADSPGFFRAAHGGTLLLDEIGDLPLALQPKLLRVLEEKEVVPLGDTRAVAIDVRVVAAAQESLEQAALSGRFRRDVYARLAGLTLRLPPLRERIEDIPALFGHFLSRFSESEPPAPTPRLLERLCLYDWPLNVRELELLAQQLAALRADERELRTRHLPERIRRAREPGATPGQLDTRPELERLGDALRRHGGNIARAAAELGISRQRAYRWIESSGIELEALRQGAQRERPEEPG
jgi:transcriptional regulator with AAA-type ATPase domain